MSGKDFDFGIEAGFGFEASIADDLLSFDAMPDLTPEYPVNDVGDLQAAAPVREKTEDEIIFEVEDTLLNLLAQERRQDLLVLTGELPDPTSNIESDVTEEFGSLYTQAILANPALKWYAKLTKMLSSEQFFMDGDKLNLRIGRDLFKKTIQPFLSDFQEEFAEESPLVQIVRDLAGSAADSAKKETEASIDKSLARRSHGEAGQFDPSDVDFDDLPGMDDLHAAELNIEDDIFGNPEQDVTADLKISLRDLSSKAVAEYCDHEKIATAEVSAMLQNEGFSRQEANEIAGIVKYMRLDRSLKARADGNYGGDVNLPFTI